ncbi:hypothetical protein [Streptomyces cacaoi]|uniref:Uncharacterized protein n=1 Tax=Streptomyces cacaoi TaxID=1898 RepID=A0A4Y3R166_STRCI|nr:hypothetical protein [Streptomyces cacaoi]GEB50428.1 hypothetical protein SCA03_29790 [Streptomyces cacaoi]
MITDFTADVLIGNILVNGGATWAPGKAAPTAGYAVSLPGHEVRIPVNDPERAGRLAWYVASTLRLVLERTDRERYFGAWVDSGDICLDVSEVIENFEDAIYAGVAADQDAIFGIREGDVYDLRTGRWGSVS